MLEKEMVGWDLLMGEAVAMAGVRGDTTSTILVVKEAQVSVL